MKVRGLLFLLLYAMSVQAQQHDWENPSLTGQHLLPPHAHFVPETAAGKAPVLSLDGSWKFHLAPHPGARPEGFQQPSFDVSRWKEIKVPANWQTEGYASYIFTDVEYPFPPNPPFVPKEDNPVGSYRRNFQVPADWQGKQIVLHLGAVNAFGYVWINGRYTGLSKDSKTPAEFDITPYIRSGENTIAIQVFRFCDGSYLEGQDMWKLSGIERSVYLVARAPLHVYDFFARCGLQNSYKDGNLQLDILLNKRPAAADRGKRLLVELKDGNNTLFRQTLPITNDSLYHLQHILPDIRSWNAEHPELYRLSITLTDKRGNTIETFAHDAGFRDISLQHGLFLVNGVPVKIKGVNRHEHHPLTGKVVDEAGMLRDIQLMKAWNINAVRTSHYPNAEEWYRLCDRYGIYVVDEANIECDGMNMHPMKTLADKPEWKAAWLDRTRRMIERDKNHCSIITWSLGNESGFGDNFIATYQWAKQKDVTRPVQYEGAGTRPYTDIVCPMYKALPYMLEYVREYRARPMIQCEYAHMMGNSGGNLQDDWEMINRYPQLQGGFIWDFSDQAFLRHDSLQRPIWAYGGDMGRVGATSDTSFCADGMLSADRTPHPQAFEVKKVYQPVHVETVSLSADLLRIYNRYDFSTLEHLRLQWRIKANGQVVDSGRLPVLHTAPHQSDTVRLALPVINPAPGISYYLDISAIDRKTNVVVATEQLLLPWHRTMVPQQAVGGQLQVSGQANAWMVRNEHFSLKINDGWLSAYEHDGNSLIQSPLRPDFWRAPTDNDIGNSMQLRCAVWQHAAEDARLLSCKVLQQDNRKIVLRATHALPAVKATYQTTYTILANGEVQIAADFLAGDTLLPEIPRMGMRMQTPPALEQVSWLGRGPFDNYADRKYAANVDVYTLQADQFFHPYPRAQESGYRTDVQWMALQDTQGRGWLLRTDSLVSTGILHFDPARLAFNRSTNNHGGSMYNQPMISWNIDYGQNGVGGDNSWGAKAHGRYALPYRNYHYRFILRPLRAGEKPAEKAFIKYE